MKNQNSKKLGKIIIFSIICIGFLISVTACYYSLIQDKDFTTFYSEDDIPSNSDVIRDFLNFK